MLNQNENGFFIIQPTLDQMLEFSFYFLDQQTNSRKTRKPRKAKEKGNRNWNKIDMDNLNVA